MVTTNNSASIDVFSFGRYRVTPAMRLLEKDGVPLVIGSRALDILIVLVEKAGAIVSNKELLARAWRDIVVEESSLRVSIAGLRKALDDGGDGIRHIGNVPGQGYWLAAPLVRQAQHPPTPAEARRYPLPRPLARMIGRDEQVAALAAQVLERRFVSIVGPGGMGKTTVAVAVGALLLPDFDGAVCFVDLSELGAPHLLASTIGSTLGLMLPAGDSTRSLAALLEERHLLLILDSCELLIEAVAALAEHLFEQVPRLFILATSREPLRVEGEHAHRLAPLEAPLETTALDARRALTFSAVQLFVDRVAANGGDFVLSDADAPAVADMCRRLDGIALAIELGAARVAAYGVHGTAALLDNRFRLAWRGRRTAQARHQTLGAVLDWSYQLLPDFERAVLRRLSVFVGPFSLEAAIAIAAAPGADATDVIDAVGGLVAKSLASIDDALPEMRYRLLDSARLYAFDKLRDSGEADAIARRHADYFARLLAAMMAGAPPYAQAAQHGAQLAHLGNVRSALEWCFAPAGDDGLGVVLAAAAAPLLVGLSLLAECSRWSGQALSLLAPEHRGGAVEMSLREAAAIAAMFANGNSDAVRGDIMRALDLARTLGDLPHELRLLAGLDIFHTRIGDFQTTVELAQRSRAIAAKLGHPAPSAMAEWMLGVAYHLVGNQAGAQRHCEAGMAMLSGARHASTIFFGYDHRTRATVILAGTLWLRGFADRALEVAEQAVAEAREVGHPVSACMSLIYATQVCTWIGEWDRAAELVDRLILYARKNMLGPYHAVGLGLKGCLRVTLGAADEGIALLNDCREALRSGHHQVLDTVFSCGLAQGLAATGRLDDARAVLQEALAKGEQMFNAPEILRIEGELLLAGSAPDLAGAEHSLRRALACARRQDALSWELRAAHSLARLYRNDGRDGDGRLLLTEVLDRYTEGFDSADYREAARFLDTPDAA